jgi:hypothetical protein
MVTLSEQLQRPKRSINTYNNVMASASFKVTTSVITSFPPLAMRSSTLALPVSTTTASPCATSTQPTAAGVIATIIVLTATFSVYRCWKIRRSGAVRYYEQARLWKGFTPVTLNPNTARTTLVEEKMKDIYFTQIRSPDLIFSPPLSGQWQTQGGPGTPRECGGERAV